MINYFSTGSQGGKNTLWDSNVSHSDGGQGLQGGQAGSRADGDHLGLLLVEVFLPVLPICLSLLLGSASLAAGLTKCMSGELYISPGHEISFQRLSWLQALLSQLCSCQSWKPT